jgi:hypothetical protein
MRLLDLSPNNLKELVTSKPVSLMLWKSCLRVKILLLSQDSGVCGSNKILWLFSTEKF